MSTPPKSITVLPDGHPKDDTGTVVLAHHWTHPETGENVLPGTEVTLPADQARQLVLNTFAHPKGEKPAPPAA